MKDACAAGLTLGARVKRPSLAECDMRCEIGKEALMFKLLHMQWHLEPTRLIVPPPGGQHSVTVTQPRHAA